MNIPNLNWTPLKNDELRWIMVDFDETLCHNSGLPNFYPLEPIEGAKEAMQTLTDRGYKITVFTARGWSDYSLIETWLNYYSIPFRRIICGKPLARWLIDDRAMQFKGDWKEITDRL